MQTRLNDPATVVVFSSIKSLKNRLATAYVKDTTDFFQVMSSGKARQVRLHGIDSPEKRQAFGNRAKQATSKLVFGQTVTVRDLGQDR